ncbi:MAG: GAF domain-containing protein [Ignavibacteria bacterium]
MRFNKSLNIQNQRRAFILIAFFFLALSLISAFMNLVVFRMTTDDCLWVPQVDSLSRTFALKITHIIENGVADKAGLKDGDLLIAINGQKFYSSAEAMAILNQFKNQTIIYTIQRDTQILNVSIYVYKFLNLLYLIFWILGLIFLAVGTMVGYAKPQELSSRLFFYLSCAASIGLIMFSGSSPFGSFIIGPKALNSRFLYTVLQVLVISVQLLFVLSAFMFQALFVHFLITYPIKYQFPKRKTLVIFLYIATFSYYLIKQIVTYIVLGELDTDFSPLEIFLPLQFFIILGIIVYRRSYKSLKDNYLQQPLKIINYGFLLGVVGLSYLLLLLVFSKKPIFLINPYLLLPVLLMLAIPLSFTYSIFKYRILDTETVVKKGVVFTITTVVVLGIYVILLLVMNIFVRNALQIDSDMLTLAIMIILTFSFDTVNQKARELVDKHFYRERYNYRKALLEFVQEITTNRNISELLERINTKLKTTIKITNFNILILNPAYKQFVFSNLSNKSILADEKLESIFLRIQSYSEPSLQSEPSLKKSQLSQHLYTSYYYFFSELSLKELPLSDEEQLLLKSADISLSIPLIIKNQIIGFVNLGQKNSGKAFSEEDIDLLKTLAFQISVSIENTLLYEEENKKQRILNELKLAENIQQHLSTGFSEIDDFDVAVYVNSPKVLQKNFLDLLCNTQLQLLISYISITLEGIPAVLHLSKIQAVLQTLSFNYKDTNTIVKNFVDFTLPEFGNKISTGLILFGFDKTSKRLEISSLNCKNLILFTDNSIASLENLSDTTIQDSNKNYIDHYTLHLKPNDVLLLHSESLFSKGEIQKIYKIITDNKELPAEELKFLLYKSIKFDSDTIFFTILKAK